MMKLYTVPGACSMACDIVFEETGVPFERVLLSFDKGDLETPAFHRINPKGAVPALEIESGTYLTEGTAIMQYIADQKPEMHLFPKTGMDHFRAIEWMSFISTELHKATFGALFAAEHFIPDTKACTEFETNVTHVLHERLDYVNTRLEGKTYCVGNQFTICDAYLFTVLSWSKHLDIDLTKWKNITTFQARTFERPSVQKAMKGEGLIK